MKIQETKGAILLDLQDVGVTLKIDDKEEKFLLHRTKEEDDDRTRIYKGLEMDGAIMYGKPDRIPPLWLHGIMEMEMEFLVCPPSKSLTLSSFSKERRSHRLVRLVRFCCSFVRKIRPKARRRGGNSGRRRRNCGLSSRRVCSGLR